MAPAVPRKITPNKGVQSQPCGSQGVCNGNNVANGNENIAGGYLPNGQITLGVQDRVYHLNMGEAYDIYAPRNVQVNFIHGLRCTTIVFSGGDQVDNAEMVHINLPADAEPDFIRGPHGFTNIIVPGAHVHHPGHVDFVQGVQFLRGRGISQPQADGTHADLARGQLNGALVNGYLNGVPNNNNDLVLPNGLHDGPAGIPPRPGKPDRKKPRKAPCFRACMGCSMGKTKCTRTAEGCTKCTKKGRVCSFSPEAMGEDENEETPEEDEDEEAPEERDTAEPEKPEEPEEFEEQ